MRHRGAKTWLSLLAALSLILWAGLASAEMPTNVILMISDGMGYNTVKATGFWTHATPVYETFPVKYGVSTFSASNPNVPAYDPSLAWSDFNYVKTGATDSASAATAMATGVKNYDGQINWSVSGAPLTNIVQIAGGLGKATGVVTTVEWSHATPAGMVAHNVNRDNYAAIANEMLNSKLNVIMGAGNPGFNDNGQAAAKSTQYVGGDTSWSQLTSGAHPAGWTLIQEKSEFEALAANPTPPTKVVGTVQAYTTTQQARGNATVKGADPANPSGVKFNPNVPSLATMTQGALNVLKQNANGFFLMVEGGAVDWASHAPQLDRMIEEQMDFDAAVRAVVAWVNANSNWDKTLLIVTSDHETGYLWGPTAGVFNNLVDKGAGTLPGAYYNSGGHTNSLVPLYAIGAGANLFAGYADQCDNDPIWGRGLYVDNTEIFPVMNGNPVPIPGTVWLPSDALVGLGLCRRQACAHPN